MQSMDDHGKVLAIRDLDTKATSLVVSNSCRSRDFASQTKLIFHRYGERYFLNQIWVEGNDSGHELLPSPREKEIAKDFSVRNVVLMATRR